MLIEFITVIIKSKTIQGSVTVLNVMIWCDMVVGLSFGPELIYCLCTLEQWYSMYGSGTPMGS